MNFQLYNQQTTFLLNNVGYKINQDPDVGIAIDDPRTLEGVKTQTGAYITYGTNLHQPFTVDFSAIAVNYEKQTLFMKTWLEGTFFTIVFEGVNDQGEKTKATLKNAHFRQSPIQLSMEQNKASLRLLISAPELIIEKVG